MGDLLEDRGLPRLGGRNDQASLPLPDGCDEVDDPGEDPIGLGLDLETESLIREEGGQGLELGPAHCLVGGHPVDLVDPHHCGELLFGARGPDRAGDDVALAEAELAHLIGRHVDVFVPGEVAGDPEEPIPLGKDVEEAFADLEILFRNEFVVALATATTAAALAVAATELVRELLAIVTA